MAENDGGPAAAGGRMRRDGRNTDAVHVMVGVNAVAGGVGQLGEPSPVERIRIAFRGLGLADSSGSAIAATSAAPSPSHDGTNDRPAVLFLGGHNRHRRHSHGDADPAAADVHVHGDGGLPGDDDKADVARGGGLMPGVLPAVRLAAAAFCGLWLPGRWSPW